MLIDVGSDYVLVVPKLVASLVIVVHVQLFSKQASKQVSVKKFVCPTSHSNQKTFSSNFKIEIRI